MNTLGESSGFLPMKPRPSIVSCTWPDHRRSTFPISGSELPAPSLEIQEPQLLIIGLAGLVVFTADDDIALAIVGTETDVMVGVKSIPVECIGDCSGRNRRGDGISQVGRLFCMDHEPVVEGRIRGDYHGIGLDLGTLLDVNDRRLAAFDLTHAASRGDDAAKMTNRLGQTLQIE